MEIGLLVAYAKNRVIGKDNRLLWHLRSDLLNFKEITSGHGIIMGRKTFESIGRALPHRVNVVLSRGVYHVDDQKVHVARTFGEAIEICKEENMKKLFIIGGGEIYQAFFNLASTLYLTEVDAEIEGDTFFPEFDFDQWKEVERKEFKKSEQDDFNFVFKKLVKI